MKYLICDFEQFNYGLYAEEVELFQILTFNQCFMNNMDKYERVMVQDVDELIIPRNNRLFRRDSDFYAYLSDLHLETVHDRQGLLGALGLGSSCLSESESMSQIDAFVENIEKAAINGSKRTLYFKMGHHLNDETVNAIIDGLSKYLYSSERKSSRLTHVHETGLLHADSLYGPFAFKIVMKSKKDILFAKNLVKVYKLLIIELRQKMKEVVRNVSGFNHFDRFVFINGKLTEKLYGKTMHHTDSTLSIDIHRELNASEPSIELNPQSAHVSHFRVKLNTEVKGNNESQQIPYPIDIRDINFDFNYLFCYYRNVFKSLAHVDLLDSN